MKLVVVSSCTACMHTLPSPPPSFPAELLSLQFTRWKWQQPFQPGLEPLLADVSSVTSWSCTDVSTATFSAHSVLQQQPIGHRALCGGERLACVLMYLCLHTQTYVCMYVCAYVHTCTCQYVPKAQAHIHLNECTYKHFHIRMYVCIYRNMHPCTLGV